MRGQKLWPCPSAGQGLSWLTLPQTTQTQFLMESGWCYVGNAADNTNIITLNTRIQFPNSHIYPWNRPYPSGSLGDQKVMPWIHWHSQSLRNYEFYLIHCWWWWWILYLWHEDSVDDPDCNLDWICSVCVTSWQVSSLLDQANAADDGYLSLALITTLHWQQECLSSRNQKSHSSHPSENS